MKRVLNFVLFLGLVSGGPRVAQGDESFGRSFPNILSSQTPSSQLDLVNSVITRYNRANQAYVSGGPQAFVRELSDLLPSEIDQKVVSKFLGQLPDLYFVALSKDKNFAEKKILFYRDAQMNGTAVFAVSMSDFLQGITRFGSKEYRYDANLSFEKNLELFSHINETSSFIWNLFLPQAQAASKGMLGVIGAFVGGLLTLLLMKLFGSKSKTPTHSDGGTSGGGGGLGAGTSGGPSNFEYTGSTGGGGDHTTAGGDGAGTAGGNNPGTDANKPGSGATVADGKGCKEFKAVDEAKKVAQGFDQKVLAGIGEVERKHPNSSFGNGLDAKGKRRKDDVKPQWQDASENRFNCSTATNAAFEEACRADGNVPPEIDPSKFKRHQSDGVGPWGYWDANGPGVALFAKDSGIGTNSLVGPGLRGIEKADYGDFIKVFWTENMGPTEEGHLAVFLGCKNNQLCFWTANSGKPLAKTHAKDFSTNDGTAISTKEDGGMSIRCVDQSAIEGAIVTKIDETKLRASKLNQLNQKRLLVQMDTKYKGPVDLKTTYSFKKDLPAIGELIGAETPKEMAPEAPEKPRNTH